MFKDKTVLVTGGSSGIGFELARLFAAEGARVVLASRQADKLAEASAKLRKEFDSPILSVTADLSQETETLRLVHELASRQIIVDVLVNNAGFGITGKFQDMDLKKCLAMVDINVRSMLTLTRLFLPSMIDRRFGRILNVASTAGFQAVPIEAAYAASKAFVLVFSEAIADELEGTRVKVTCLCPGPTDTPFFKNGAMAASATVRKNMMDSRQVSRAGFEALKKGKPLVIAGWRNKTVVFLERLVPRGVVTRIARRAVE